MPVLSFIASLMVMLSVAALTLGLTPDVFGEGGSWSPVNTVISLAAYLGMAFVGVYFHAAVVSAAHERLEGGDPTLGSAFRAANKHLGKLFVWSLMVATVNLILQALRERGGMAGQIAASLGGAAWNLATFFVVPQLLFTEDGVGSSLKASGRLFKQRWGETVAGHFGLGLAFGAMTVVWVLGGVFLSIALSSVAGVYGLFAGIAITVLGAIFIALLGSVLSAVYKVALYRYARGQDAGPFGSLEQAAY